jgi:hypothetical protein
MTLCLFILWTNRGSKVVLHRLLGLQQKCGDRLRFLGLGGGQICRKVPAGRLDFAWE